MSSLEIQKLVFEALADDNRRRLIGALRIGDGQTAAELFVSAKLPSVTTMKGLRKHLRVLKKAGLIRIESGDTAGVKEQVFRLQRQHLYRTLSPWLTKFKGPVGKEFDRARRDRENRFRPGMVWLNPSTGIFHPPASRYFGKGASWIFLSRHDAITQGDEAKMHRVTRLPSREKLNLWSNRDAKTQALTLTFDTVPGRQYHIQYCDDGMFQFHTLKRFVAAVGQQEASISDCGSRNALTRFYRIMRSQAVGARERMEGWHDSRVDG